MIPVNEIFSPGWWNRRFAICFEEPFHLDIERRIANHVFMRAALYELFGIGTPNPKPRPVIGSRERVMEVNVSRCLRRRTGERGSEICEPVRVNLPSRDREGAVIHDGRAIHGAEN